MNLQTEIRIAKALTAGIIASTVFMASTAHAGQIADIFRHYNRKLSQQQALNFERIVNHTGKSFGISPNLIASIIVVESGARPNVASRGGDYGLMQVRYKVHKDKVRSPSELLKPEVKPSPNTEGQSGNLKQVHRFLVPVNLDEEQHILKLTAKEYDNGKTEVEDISLYDMKYTKKMSVHSSQGSPNSIGRTAGTLSDPDAISVREMLENVNDTDGNPYLNASEPETYNQSIGYYGAKEIDKKNGNSNLLDNYDVAQKMAQAGKDALTIKRATGWEQDPDKEWHYEIQDKRVRMSAIEKMIRNFNRILNMPPTTEKIPAHLLRDHYLPEVYFNKELFAAYPELKDVKFRVRDMRQNVKGKYSPYTNTITISTTAKPDEIRDVIIHEVQHWIQEEEGLM